MQRTFLFKKHLHNRNKSAIIVKHSILNAFYLERYRSGHNGADSKCCAVLRSQNFTKPLTMRVYDILAVSEHAEF